MSGYDDGDGVLGPRRARRGAGAGRLAGLDALHDARRGRRRDRRSGRPSRSVPRPSTWYDDQSSPTRSVRRRVGVWAFEALRIARGEPRFGLDTDHRAIPNEMGWLGSAVHLDKGCYRGQETVARVHTLGRPPRRLVLLLLDGSVDRLPEHGSAVVHDGRQVGFVGSSARHYELGPVGAGAGQAQRAGRRGAARRRGRRRPGGPRRPRGRPARPRPPLDARRAIEGLSTRGP